ncbi:hypothetical protein BKA64DRAFT_723003 [Cadophora sp. MPI-SDFR-AT-0126]|nr:hypothetical protein BKA64DRAFT_723003 [Leotiomycetes sp. MPI-SDFR-AT-0126]
MRKPAPANAGQRLIPAVIDELALQEPDRIIYEYVRGAVVADGMVKISMATYANAINRTAWYLENELGKCTTFEPLGYIGPGDLRYFILAVAAIKMLFSSPKNSLDGHMAVIEAAKCRTWLVPNGHDCSDILARQPMKTLSVLSLEECLEGSSVPVYPYTKTFSEARNHPCWVLHTSGSTGLPKPIIRNLQSTCSTEAHRLAPPVNGRPLLVDKLTGSRVYMTFPLFHSAGLSNGLYWPLFYDQTCLLGPQRPLTIEVVADMLKNSGAEAIITAPSTVENIAQSPECLAVLPQLKAVAWGGGPLCDQTGTLISSLTKLILIMGTTEAGWLTCVDTDREDWNYVHFHPLSGLELRPHNSGLLELWAVRKPECEKFQAVFNTFPHLNEYCFQDLYSAHPTKRDLYHYEGRADNIIVFSNGEKFNPLTMEQAIESHPCVRSALVAGQARFQTSALLELMDDVPEANIADLIQEIWPKIEKANGQAPRHAHLHKNYIVIASKDKPFLRAGKGTVQRSLTLAAYAEEVDEVYKRGESASDFAPLDTTNLETMKQGVRSYVIDTIGLTTIQDNDDIFHAGVDSLQVLTLLRHFRVGLRDGIELSASTMYSNPSITSLATAFQRLLSTNETNGYMDRTNSPEYIYEKYAKDLPLAVPKSRPCSPGATVLLTGSTGPLGSYLLDTLVRSPDVAAVYCLNRSSTAASKQMELNELRGLINSNKSRFLTADLSKPDFGLSVDDYKILSDNVTHIIHNQWQVDFSLSVRSFEPHIAGVRNLINFSAAAKITVPIIFTSSVGVVANWPGSSPVPEAEIRDFGMAGMGYGESRLIAERLLAEAGRVSGVPSTICRLGQITGPVNDVKQRGEWNRKEWVHTVIAVSAAISKLPSSLGTSDTLDWIPVDILATIILELCVIVGPRNTQSCKKFFNILNPAQGSWANLLPVIQSFEAVSNAKVVSWKDWLETLKLASHLLTEDPVILSGAKSLPFFEGLSKKNSKMTIANTEESSDTLATLRPVSKEWMGIWMRQWGY